MKPIETFKDILDAWPSLDAFAEDMQVSINYARVIRDSVAKGGSIPRKRECHLVAGAKKRRIKGITYEFLAGLYAKKGAENA